MSPAAKVSGASSGDELSEVRPEDARRYRATVEYDGTDYYGFQMQADRPTIQGALEAALGQTVGSPVRISAAGRTDSGVHALGQVISFQAPWRHTMRDLQSALNARLPEDVAVRDLGIADERFHPRFSARSRLYRYSVLNQGTRSPLARRFAHLVRRPLDLASMQRAAEQLMGWHDFRTFGDPPQGENSVRQVLRAEWCREGDFLYFDIEANAFLRRMVRTLVGALLELGVGWTDEGSILTMLAERSRSAAPAPAPACGLCLMQVKY